MAAAGGPNIVEDGLVLYLDAANIKSFRGEPTVNVINGGADRANVITNPISVGTHAGMTNTVSLTSYSSDRPNVLRYTSTNNTGYSMLNQQFSIQNQSGTTYTYSFEYKQLAGASNALQYSVVYKNGYKSPDSATAASNVTNTTVDLEDGWKRWILTYTSTYTGYNYIRFNLSTGGYLGTGDGDFDFYFDNFMLQEGSKRTRFVAGTRGTTVATGGGWADITGNSNHGEIVNGTSTSNDETITGALAFDGVNDYVSFGNPDELNFTNSFSHGVWFTRNSNATSNLRLTSKASGGSGTGQQGFSFFGSNSSITWSVNVGGVRTFTSATITVGEWYYVVGTANFSTGKQHIYLNGEEISSIDLGNTNTTNNSIEFRVGAYYIDNSLLPWDGNIGIVTVHNKALTAAEILQNYNATKGRYGL